MSEWLDIAKQLGIQIAPWTIIVVLVLYIFREKLNKGLNALLDRLSLIFRGEWSYRRFGRVFRPAIRAMHLYMRVVGLRSEKGREPTLTEAYVPLRLTPYLDEDTGRSSDLHNQSDFWTIEDALQQQNALVILGDPGAGKSTLLKYLIICFTESVRRMSSSLPGRLLQFRTVQRNNPSFVPYPFYVSLRSCRTQNETLLKDILDPETKILAGMLPSEQREKMPPGFIEHCVRKGRAVLLLDGLDEVKDEEMYAEVARKISDFKLSYPGNRLVVTCRVAGWRGGLHADFTLYRALPLDRQQQHEFIARWYQTAYKHSETEVARLKDEGTSRPDLVLQTREASASEGASQLETLLRERERLAELAANPMLLSLICLVYHQRRDLPRGRAELYDECVQILLGVWDKVDKDLRLTKPTMNEKRKILRHVAYDLHSGGRKDISRRDFVSLVMSDLGISEEEARNIVRQIEVRSWLIVERVIDRFAFSHLTLQEFFVVEYLNIEMHSMLDFATITDWNVWHEPVLLMCSKSTTPTTFIEQIVAHNRVLGLLCVAEADSTLLDVQRISHLVDATLELIHQGQLVQADLLVALVSLLAIEKSSFATQIIEFEKQYFQTLDEQEQTRQIMTVANSGTREAARLLLYLHLIVPHREEDVFSGLLAIGNNAVAEVLQWNQRKELSDTKLREFLLACHTPDATLALWERYGLESGEATEEEDVAWAESWALRLISAENDQVMRAIPYTGPINNAIWPYRKSQRTALAAVVQRCVEILRYAYEQRLYKDAGYVINKVTQFDLRVQIPLIVEIKATVKKLPPYPENGEESESEKHAWQYLERLDRDIWYTSIATRGKRGDKAFYTMIDNGLGSIVSALLAWACLDGLLWHMLPDWLLIIIIIPPALGFLVFLTITVFDWFLAKGIDFDKLPGLLVVLIVLLLFLSQTTYLWSWMDSGTQARRFIVTGKMNPWYALVFLSMAVGCGVIGGFALQAWFHLPLLIGISAISLICLFWNILWERMGAFSINSLSPWLESHPHGKIVLDEFQD